MTTKVTNNDDNEIVHTHFDPENSVTVAPDFLRPISDRLRRIRVEGYSVDATSSGTRGMGRVL